MILTLHLKASWKIYFEADNFMKKYTFYLYIQAVGAEKALFRWLRWNIQRKINKNFHRQNTAPTVEMPGNVFKSRDESDYPSSANKNYGIYKN